MPSRQLGAFDNLSVTATMEAETSLDRSRLRGPHPRISCPCQTACRPANTRAVVTDPKGSESEFGRQIPVDLEADADLNEGRGVPGHWSSSLAFPCDSKVDRGGPLRKPHATERMHRRRLLSREFYCSRPAGLPVTCRAAYHCGGKAIRCPAAAVISLNSLLRIGGLFVPLRGSSYGS